MFYTEFSEDYEEIFPFSREVSSLLKLYLPSARARILDLGCGTGAQCRDLAYGGHSVTGIDLEAKMIRKARERCPEGDFRIMDILNIGIFGEGKGFDLIFSTGNVMAHINRAEFSGILPLLKGMLRPGGQWIFQVINWDYVLNKESFRFPDIESSSKIFRRTYKNISGEKLVFSTELAEKSSGQRVFSGNTILYPIPSREYITIHEKAGFKLEEHFSDYSGAPFDPGRFSADIYIFSREAE